MASDDTASYAVSTITQQRKEPTLYHKRSLALSATAALLAIVIGASTYSNAQSPKSAPTEKQDPKIVKTSSLSKTAVSTTKSTSSTKSTLSSAKEDSKPVTKDDVKSTTAQKPVEKPAPEPTPAPTPAPEPTPAPVQTKTAVIFVPANAHPERLSWLPRQMNIPVYLDDAPMTDAPVVWVAASYGNQGDQTPVADRTIQMIDGLRAKGYNRFVLAFASLSGYAAEHLIDTVDEKALGITDIVLISSVNGTRTTTPSDVNAYFVTSSQDTAVPPSWALAPETAGWKSVHTYYGVENHNQMLRSAVLKDAFAAAINN